MTQPLKVFKLNTAPVVYEPSSLYFVKNINSQVFEVFLTSNDGQILFRSVNEADITSAINALVGVADGLVGLNADGIIAAIDGQNTLIKSADVYIWDDLKEPFIVKNTAGGNNPTFGSWGSNMQGLLFSPTIMNQVWVDYHIDHKYAMGTNVFQHIHWLPTTNATGTVRWGVEYEIAKGHGQEAFSNAVTFYMTHDLTTGKYKTHFVTEASNAQSYGASVLEPDTVVKTRIFRDAANDTYPDPVHAWQGDLHYQVGQLGTRNKAPDFFVLP